LRKRLKGEVKNGLFHMESNKLDFHEKKEVVGKDQLKDIKRLLQQIEQIKVAERTASQHGAT
jgi:hypothetical protein